MGSTEESIGDVGDNGLDGKLSDTNRDDSSVECQAENNRFQNVVRNRNRRDMTEKDLEISDLFHANMF